MRDTLPPNKTWVPVPDPNWMSLRHRQAQRNWPSPTRSVKYSAVTPTRADIVKTEG